MASPRPNSASSSVSSGLSQAPSSVSVTSNSGVYGYDGRQVGAAAPASNPPWPRMTPSDAQRFNHVFSQVDTDGDGKITGEQARQLFLSWQLPRGVLKIPFSIMLLPFAKLLFCGAMISRSFTCLLRS